MSFLPQGTPTNNTETIGAGYRRVDPGQTTSFQVETGPPNFTITNERHLKQDAQWFAEALGISSPPLAYLANGGVRDIQEAQAMNKALWSATMGYFLEDMLNLAPVVVGHTRAFFTDYVTGRGSIPAIRVGTQPYGILPTTALSHWQWSAAVDGGDIGHLESLFEMLQRIDQQWQELVSQVPHAGADGDPFQNLLMILGLHASSVEFYRRKAVGWNYIWHYELMASSHAIASRVQGALNQRARDLLAELGLDMEEAPPLFNLAFFINQDLINDPLIDDVDDRASELLSEHDHIQDKYRLSGLPEDRLYNYLHWLVHSEYEVLKNQRFENPDGQSVSFPKSLLYRLLHRSLLLTTYDSSRLLYVNHQLTDNATFREFELPNVRSERDVTRWEFMDVQTHQVFPDLSSSELPLG